MDQTSFVWSQNQLKRTVTSYLGGFFTYILGLVFFGPIDILSIKNNKGYLQILVKNH
jgi:hypothetical protein